MSARYPAILAIAACACAARADEAALYAAAKKEGKVVWYTTLIVNQAAIPLKDAFEKKYQGVTVDFSRADSIPTALKVINEAKAGATMGDVFDGIETEPAVLKAGPLVEKYVSSQADKYPAALKDPEGYWTSCNVYFLTPGYNTTLIPPASAPKTLDDLLDPKLKGKMVWSTARSAGGPSFVGVVLKARGEGEGMKYLRAFAKQDIVNTDITARAVLDQVIAGEYSLALEIFNHHASLSAAKGAPVDWLKMEPIAAPIHLISIVKGAPHANAARLFVDFILSEEGQRVMAASDYLPSMPSIAAKTPALKPEAGGFKPIYIQPDEWGRDGDRWQSIYKDLFK